MRPFKSTPGVVIAVLVLFSGGAALADPLGPIEEYDASGQVGIGPEETMIAQCGSILPDVCDYTSELLSPDAGSAGSGSLNITGGDDPSVSVTANTSGGAQGAGASGELDYYMEVVPRVTGLANVVGGVFTGEIDTSPHVDDGIGNLSLAEGLVQLFDPSGNLLYQDHLDNYTSQPGSLVTISSFVDLQPLITVFSPYEVVLSASAGTYSSGVAESAFADVDPLFTLDPAYADDYAIVYSPGLLTDAGVVPDVPEPSSMMMILGLAGIGAASRRLPGNVRCRQSACR